uniref:Fibronectin type-III domain-containing protein n=1 Tax=Megaselia scalaris TaxID=36166 RepID=T1GRR5_MEGSC
MLIKLLTLYLITICINFKEKTRNLQCSNSPISDDLRTNNHRLMSLALCCVECASQKFNKVEKCLDGCKRSSSGNLNFKNIMSTESLKLLCRDDRRMVLTSNAQNSDSNESNIYIVKIAQYSRDSSDDVEFFVLSITVVNPNYPTPAIIKEKHCSSCELFKILREKGRTHFRYAEGPSLERNVAVINLESELHQLTLKDELFYSPPLVIRSPPIGEMFPTACHDPQHPIFQITNREMPLRCIESYLRIYSDQVNHIAMSMSVNKNNRVLGITPPSSNTSTFILPDLIPDTKYNISLASINKRLEYAIIANNENIKVFGFKADSEDLEHITATVKWSPSDDMCYFYELIWHSETDTMSLPNVHQVNDLLLR